MHLGEKRLGLALGGGSARGLAHIGVLRVLEDAGLSSVAIAGTSMGSIVGAFAAAGYTARDIEQIATGMDVRDMVSFADLHPGRATLVNGQRVEAWLREWLPATFEELSTPFACVSVDLAAGAKVVHTSGDLPLALRASCSIPGVFAPVTDDGRILVDGGVLEPVPVLTLKSMGFSNVNVAVTVAGLSVLRPDFGFGDRERSGIGRFWRSARGDQSREKGPAQSQVTIVSLQVMQRELEKPALRRAQVLIAPEVAEFNGHDFLAASELIAIGEQAASAALPDLRRRLRLTRV